jgi:signal transduction histidine kinase
MNPDMLENGRRLEALVAGIMRLLVDAQSSLSRVPGNGAAAKAAAELLQLQSALAETIQQLQHGQAQLERELQQTVSQLSSQAAALQTSRAELRSVTRRLVQVQEDERRSLARDLHDTAGQAITVIGLGLSSLRRQGDCTMTVRGRIEELQTTASGLAEELHRLSANLRPSTLDRYGLVPAAEEMVASLRRQTGIEVEFDAVEPDERLPEEVETALYRIIQEACTNIARHSAARHAAISIRREDEAMCARVQDDGRGFDLPEALRRGRLGLVGMRERAEILGGTLAIETAPGEGTRLSVRVPLNGTSDANQDPAPDTRETPSVAPLEPSVSSELSMPALVRALNAALVDILAGMAGIENAEDALAFVLGRATATLGCDYAVVAEQRNRRWIISHGYALPQSLIGKRLVPSAVPLVQEIVRRGGTVVVNDTSAGSRLAAAARQSGVFSGVGLPLRGNGRLLGALSFAHSTDPIPFRPAEVAFLERVARLVALLVEVLQATPSTLPKN